MDIWLVDLNNILASGIIKNDAEMVKLIFFGNLSVPDFSFDELALLAAPEKLELFREWFESNLVIFMSYISLPVFSYDLWNICCAWDECEMIGGGVKSFLAENI